MSRRIRAEVWIVLGLSLGQAAVYAVLSLVAAMSMGPLSESTTTLNRARSQFEYLDLTLQLFAIGFALVPVALALYLLSLDDGKPSVFRRLGFDRREPWRDLMLGAILAAVIGIPGLGFYFAGRALGVTVEIILSPAQVYWWTIPVLILAAIQNSLLEELVVVGYLMTRLREAGWSVGAVIVTSAALRGTYHLYQGFGQGLGNFIMGLVFGYWFHRTGRVMLLIVAHAILDIVAFVGYALLADYLGLR